MLPLRSGTITEACCPLADRTEASAEVAAVPSTPVQQRQRAKQQAHGSEFEIAPDWQQPEAKELRSRVAQLQGKVVGEVDSGEATSEGGSSTGSSGSGESTSDEKSSSGSDDGEAAWHELEVSCARDPPLACSNSHCANP